MEIVRKTVMDKVQVATYNCRGLSFNNKQLDRIEINNLLDSHDLICLQETWLSKNECKNINSYRSDFRGVANSPNDDTGRMLAGRAGRKEGVAILWNVKLEACIKPMHFEHEWLVCVKIHNF